MEPAAAAAAADDEDDYSHTLRGDRRRAGVSASAIPSPHA
jgi:hypothetical protein